MYAVSLGIQIYNTNPGQNHSVLHDTDPFIISSFCSGSLQVQRMVTIPVVMRQILPQLFATAG